MLNGTVLLPVFGIINIFVIGSYIKNRKERSIFYLLLQLIFCAYLYCLFQVTLFDIPIDPMEINDLKQMNYERINIIPFKTISSLLRSKQAYSIALQLGGNLILLLPLGIYIPLMQEKMRKSFLVLWAIGSAAGIELLQFLIGLFIGVQYRSVDIDDVILNMIGFGIGYILHFAILPLYHMLTEKK